MSVYHTLVPRFVSVFVGCSNGGYDSSALTSCSCTRIMLYLYAALFFLIHSLYLSFSVYIVRPLCRPNDVHEYLVCLFYMYQPEPDSTYSVVVYTTIYLHLLLYCSQNRKIFSNNSTTVMQLNNHTFELAKTGLNDFQYTKKESFFFSFCLPFSS